MGEYLPEPAIERGPMPIDKALLFASNMKLCRREQDFALLALADEVRRLREQAAVDADFIRQYQREREAVNRAAGDLGEFILEQAG